MKLKIVHDDTAESPGELGDTGLFIVANHRQFFVPEPGQKRIPSDPEEVVNHWKETHWVFPMEAYIHSGVILALSPEGNFPDRRWDVSQLGWVFAAKKEWRLSEAARSAARNLIETWNQYLSGDVWGYVIDDDEGNHLDSCWGISGREYCEEEAKAAMESLEQVPNYQI